ncbi:MAG: hypothetical protein ABR569_03970 [Gaiellaceae bacterium]
MHRFDPATGLHEELEVGQPVVPSRCAGAAGSHWRCATASGSSTKAATWWTSSGRSRRTILLHG